MIEGTKYRIVYRIPGIHIYPREAVLIFISQDEEHYYFSGRPDYGTQTLEKEHVSEMYETNPETRPYLNRRYHGETRVL